MSRSQATTIIAKNYSQTESLNIGQVAILTETGNSRLDDALSVEAFCERLAKNS